MSHEDFGIQVWDPYIGTIPSTQAKETGYSLTVPLSSHLRTLRYGQNLLEKRKMARKPPNLTTNLSLQSSTAYYVYIHEIVTHASSVHAIIADIIATNASLPFLLLNFERASFPMRLFVLSVFFMLLVI